MLDNFSNRLLSRPIIIHWAGWKSDTYRLQQAGWQLSAEQDVQFATMRLAFHHSALQCYALTQPMDFRYQAMMGFDAVPPELHVQYFATRMNVTLVESMVPSFQPIDAAPQMVSSPIKRIEDFQWFAAPLARTEEIIVEPETVAELLERIRLMQSPRQAELRQARSRRQREGESIEGRPRQAMHAQILTLAA